ncbi:MAG: S-layer homology domain-containing protein [Anaerolineales bacterium]|nr:S-layer homology domain-containing protein [Anaerolineales bacterium]
MINFKSIKKIGYDKAIHFALLFAFLFAFIPVQTAHAASITVAAGVVVVNGADGHCSLREAIMAANTDAAVNECVAGSGDDTINLPASVTYTITDFVDSTNGQNGLPAITSKMTINANNSIVRRDPGLSCLINGSASATEFRIFYLTSTANLTLNKMSLQSGCSDGVHPNGSGGILYNNGGKLNFDYSGISSSKANQFGGALFNSGITNVTNGTLSFNTATSYGGAIENYSTLNITNSVFIGNLSNYGAAVDSWKGTLAVVGSVFSGNAASSSGGAISNLGPNTLSIVNSTFSANTANNEGGAIYNTGEASLNFVTITANIADNDTNAIGNGGGLLTSSSGNSYVKNSIISGNIDRSANAPDCGGILLSQDYNLIQVTTGCTVSGTIAHNIIGQDPQLGALVDNSGVTKTHALLNTSPARDRIPYNTNTCGQVTTDQRGIARPQPTGGQCDIGAYEVQPGTIVIAVVGTNGNDTFNFTSSIPGYSAFPVNILYGAGSTTFSNISPGSYTVTQSILPSGWVFTNVACVDSDSGTTVAGQIATIDLDSGQTVTCTYTNTPSTTFVDVPTSYWAWSWIERIYNAGITSGCTSSPRQYCPDTAVTRAQMSVFLEKGKWGSGFVPPNVPATFADTGSHWAKNWIQALASDGITSGCGGGNYCPDYNVSRAQMAIFLLKAAHGSSYTPPAATGRVFNDVTSSYWAASWIEQLSNEGITGGCGSNNYCPDGPVTRAEMAVFLVKVFNLP